ncbi:MAG: radical SAM family heme chaperone HemW [Saprospiraceae bacterium]|nr:radical SAM family heme chaperone HemW [Saprospiraceae bacterium]
MAGIYLHIPFCKHKCSYCNFFSVISQKNKADFLKTLSKEIYLQKDYLIGETIDTIYFGGGTPSLLSASELNSIFEEIVKFHSISENAEITLEANPDDLSDIKLKELKLLPINRLSIGIQSFHQDDLDYLGRTHDAKQAINCIKQSRDSGFDNLTIDLIYGIPTLSNEKWRENLKTTFGFGVQHVSAYSLTVEPKTPLDVFIKKGKLENIDDEQSNEHYLILMEQMKLHDFIQYEISNFCKEGFESKHNSNYWKMKKYLGLGPSAHSYNLESRQWNIASISQYIDLIKNQKSQFEIEKLTIEQKYNEYIMTSLRTIQGCDLEFISKKFGEKFRSYCQKESEPYLQSSQIIKENNKLFLSDKGKLFADGISGSLFI